MERPRPSAGLAGRSDHGRILPSMRGTRQFGVGPMKYSLIIPCYNEERSVRQLAQRCLPLISTGSIEVVFVDNGSTDESARELQLIVESNPGFRVVSVPVNRGYGFGILSGLGASLGEVVGWTHADLQTDPRDVLEAISFFEKFGTDNFLKGRRFGRPIADTAFTVGMSAFETALLRRPLWDINAQPTMFPRSFFESWVDPPEDFSLDLFAYYLASIRGLPIHRFPVRFGDRVHGSSHWNVNWTAKRRFILRTIDYSIEMRKRLRS